MIYFRPLVGIEETSNILGADSRNCLQSLWDQSLGHSDISIATDFTCDTSATIDVMIHAELLHIRLILWRVYSLLTILAYHMSLSPCSVRRIP